jgi:hypothetical protein
VARDVIQAGGPDLSAPREPKPAVVRAGAHADPPRAETLLPAGRWLASVAPFEELFFDERLVCGLTMRAALELLERRDAGQPPPRGARRTIRRRD